jgi:hypothetical protein
MIKMVFFLLLWLHIISCTWWLIIVENKDTVDENGRSLQWRMPLDFLNYSETILFKEDT